VKQVIKIEIRDTLLLVGAATVWYLSRKFIVVRYLLEFASIILFFSFFLLGLDLLGKWWNKILDTWVSRRKRKRLKAP
jgi:hypothetical protein